MLQELGVKPYGCPPKDLQQCSEIKHLRNAPITIWKVEDERAGSADQCFCHLFDTDAHSTLADAADDPSKSLEGHQHNTLDGNIKLVCLW